MSRDRGTSSKPDVNSLERLSKDNARDRDARKEELAKREKENPFTLFREEMDVGPKEKADEYAVRCLDRLRFEQSSARKRNNEEGSAENAYDLMLMHSKAVRGVDHLDVVRKDPFGRELDDVMKQVAQQQRAEYARKKAEQKNMSRHVHVRLPRMGEHFRETQSLKFELFPHLKLQQQAKLPGRGKSPRSGDHSPSTSPKSSKKKDPSINPEAEFEAALQPANNLEKFCCFTISMLSISHAGKITDRELYMYASLDSLHTYSVDPDVHAEWGNEIEAAATNIFRCIDINTNGVLSSAEWEGGMPSTGWYDFYNRVTPAEFLETTDAGKKRIVQSIFHDLGSSKGGTGKALLNLPDYVVGIRRTLHKIFLRATAAKAKAERMTVDNKAEKVKDMAAGFKGLLGKVRSEEEQLQKTKQDMQREAELYQQKMMEEQGRGGEDGYEDGKRELLQRELQADAERRKTEFAEKKSVKIKSGQPEEPKQIERKSSKQGKPMGAFVGSVPGHVRASMSERPGAGGAEAGPAGGSPARSGRSGDRGEQQLALPASASAPTLDIYFESRSEEADGGEYEGDRGERAGLRHQLAGMPNWGTFTIADFRADFVRVFVFPHGDRFHKGAESFVSRKLCWQDVLMEVSKNAMPACGQATKLYDTNLQLVRPLVSALQDGQKYLACAGEKPTVWSKHFPCTRTMPLPPLRAPGPVADPLSVTSTTAKLLRIQDQRARISHALNQSIVERFKSQPSSCDLPPVEPRKGPKTKAR